MFGLGVSDVTQMIEKAFLVKKNAIAEEIKNEFTDVFLKYKKTSEERAEEVLRMAKDALAKATLAKSATDATVKDVLTRMAQAQEEQSQTQREILEALHGLSKAFMAAVTIETESETAVVAKAAPKKKKK